jgi:hypothetical protein
MIKNFKTNLTESWAQDLIARGSVELVPVEFLWSVKDFDREKSTHKGEGYLDSLTKEIAKKGIQAPVAIYFYYESGKVILGEGNHRLAVARRLGLTELPAYVHVAARKTSSRKGKKIPIPTGVNWNNTFRLSPSGLGIASSKLKDKK